jgi:hypothetical protein
MFTLILRQPAASLSELHVRNCFLLGFDAFKKLLYSRRFASLKRQLYIQQQKVILQQKFLNDRHSKLCYIKKKHDEPGWYLKVNFYLTVNTTRFGYKNTSNCVLYDVVHRLYQGVRYLLHMRHKYNLISAREDIMTL